MNRIQSQSKIGGAIMAVSLLLSLGVAYRTTAQAQYPDDRSNRSDDDRSNRRDNDEQNRGRNWDLYGNYGGSSQLRETALSAGYDEGVNQGRRVRDQRNSANYHSLSSYRNATMGYRTRLGDREVYRRYFREAFESGYNSEVYARGGRGRDRNYDADRNRNYDGDRNRDRNWDGYGNFGGSAQLRQTALNAGYNEGNKQGQNDRNRGSGQDYLRQSEYQKATKDYSSPLGNRELYRRYFREAYKTGYRDGLNGS